MIRRISISSALSLGLILSLIFERNVVGHHYATLVFAGVFALYWMIELILDYVDFRKRYIKEYDIYKVQLLNSNASLTMEMIDSGKKRYYKKFKRTKLKESTFRIVTICCLLGIVIADICGFFM